MATASQLTAGTDVDSYCGKCKLTLAHIVVAHAPGRAAKVKCKTCSAEHAMRREKAAKSPAAKKTTSRKPAAKAMIAFEELAHGKDLGASRFYRPAETFELGQVLEHATFGLGVVHRVSPDRKIEVLFREQGNKVLAHARTA